MTSVSLSEEGQKDLEEIRKTFDIKPSKRRTVEKALKLYKQKRLSEP